MKRGSSITYKACACARLHCRECRIELLGRSHADELELDRQRGRHRLEVFNLLRLPRRSGFQRTATRVRRGIASLSSCSRLTLSSVLIVESPVTFPPGCARLATKPDATGSATIAMTMGMVDVARLTAWAAGVVSTTITSTLRWTSSVANSGALVVVAVGVAPFDHHVASFGVARVQQALLELLHVLAVGRGDHEEDPDAPRRCRLLRIGGVGEGG